MADTEKWLDEPLLYGSKIVLCCGIYSHSPHISKLIVVYKFEVVKIQLNSTNKLIFCQNPTQLNKLILLHNWSIIHHHNELVVLLTLGRTCAIRVGANANPHTGGSLGVRVLLRRPPLPD